MTDPKPPHWICLHCQRGPALDVKLRRHQGFLIAMRTATYPGPFCRSCGLRTFQEVTTKTMWQGWWGIFSVFVNAWVIASNFAVRARLLGLSEPR